MKELPQYTLLDILGWFITRWVPLNASACATILSIINNDPDFDMYVPMCAGLTPENSLGFTQVVPRTDKFYNLAKAIIVSPTLYTYLEMAYLLTNSLLDDRLISMLMTTVNITPEFSPFLAKLQGINSENNLNYQPVINQLVSFPVFRINAQQFYLYDEK